MQRLRPPRVVLDIAEQLEQAGHETWFVGGAVRDALLGHQHLDWDLATAATPTEVQGLFGYKRTIPVGIEFGTVGVLDAAGTLHEITTFRRDVRTDGRHAVVEFGVSLEDDLARRDFTINAIAYSASKDELFDPFGGRLDLRRRLLRAVGDPDRRMAEDRLRALRALRFAARLDFEIEPATMAAIERSAPHLGRLSPERIKQEIDKTMEQVRLPSVAFRLWKRTGAFATLIPALADLPDDLLGVPDCLARPGLAGRPQRRINRVAGLLCGIAPAEAERILTQLRFSKHEAQWAVRIITRWQLVRPEIEAALAEGGAVRDRDVRRWVATVGRLHIGAVLRLADAVWAVGRSAAAGEAVPSPESVRALHRRMLRSAFRDPVELRDLGVDGDDLRRAGIPAGPELGKILQSLLQSVLDDPAKNRADWLLHEAQRLSAGGLGRES